jgi:hypothetical protein
LTPILTVIYTTTLLACRLATHLFKSTRRPSEQTPPFTSNGVEAVDYHPHITALMGEV